MDAYATWKETHGEIIKKDGILIAGMKEYLDALGDRIPVSLASSDVLSTFITGSGLLLQNDQYAAEDLHTWSVPHFCQLIHQKVALRTGICMHFLDGQHRVVAYDSAVTGTVMPGTGWLDDVGKKIPVRSFNRVVTS